MAAMDVAADYFALGVHAITDLLHRGYTVLFEEIGIRHLTVEIVTRLQHESRGIQGRGKALVVKGCHPVEK